MKVISLVNQKGGVGKTTLALSLASYWLKAGKKVAIIDTDPQGTVQYFAEQIDTENGKLKDLEVYSLETASELDELSSLNVHYTIIDTQGRDSDLTKRTIAVSDLVLLPVRPSAPDINASGNTYKKVTAQGKPCAYVVSQVISGSTLNQECFEAFNENNLPYLENHIGMFVNYSRLFTQGETPYSASPYSIAGVQIRKIAEEIDTLLEAVK